MRRTSKNNINTNDKQKEPDAMSLMQSLSIRLFLFRFLFLSHVDDLFLAVKEFILQETHLL